MDQAGVHATTCKCGGLTLQFHDAIRDGVKQAFGAAGHLAHNKQVVPQLGRWVKKRRRNAREGEAEEQCYEEAILNVVCLMLPAALLH